MIQSIAHPPHRLLLILFFMGACLMFNGFTLAQSSLKEDPKWPEGEAGIDFNVLNSRGQKVGPWIRVWPNETIYYVGAFEADVPVGEFVHYYESGKIMSIIQHLDNGQKSSAQHFRPDGSLQAEGAYLTAKELNENKEALRNKDGEWRFYDNTGQLRLIENYDVGTLNGESKTIASSGVTIEEGSYAQGERDGVWKTYSETGTLLSEMGYQSGFFEGVCRVNYASGMPRSIGMYKDGVENGFWKTFLESGKVETTRQFELGTLIHEVYENGTVFRTFPDERPKEEFHVIDKKKEGFFREWHDNGEWVFEEEIDEVSGQTFVRRVLKGQQIRREGEYQNGLLEGDVFHFDMNGRIQRTERFESGKLIESIDQ